MLRPESGSSVLDFAAPAAVSSLAVTSDGSRIATGSPTGVITVWDLPELDRALKTVAQELPFDRPPGFAP